MEETLIGRPQMYNTLIDLDSINEPMGVCMRTFSSLSISSILYYLVNLF